MEPWDGPASIAFTDGTVIGAVLDRNGLRPSRYWVTDDGLVVMASEVGVLDIAPEKIVAKGRLAARPHVPRRHRAGPHRRRPGDQVRPWPPSTRTTSGCMAGVVELSSLPLRSRLVTTHESVRHRQQLFGFTEEELRILLLPMARDGAEPIGSMGTDTPIAVLSRRSRLLFDYFTQLFAQVTNPPLDAIREELVTSLGGTIGPEGNLLDPGPASCRQIFLPFPVISNEDVSKIVGINDDGDMPGFAATKIRGLYEVARRRGRARGPAGGDLRRGRHRDRARRPDHRALRPRGQPSPRADPEPAAHQRRPPPPDPQP